MKIMLAVDGSDCSDVAVAEVAHRPWPADSQIRIITVIEPLLLPMSEPVALPGDYFDQVEEAAHEQAKAVIDKTAEKVKATGLQLSSEILRGNPKQAILEEAEKWAADLVVVGSHGYRGFTRLWLGSVSQAIASNAHCSVEIVRARG